MEVVFQKSTFIKLIVWSLGPLLLTLIGAISAFFYFYHETKIHIDDPNIHLGKTERTKLETKAEAKVERKKIRDNIKQHVNVKMREVKVEQREMLQQATKKLQTQQAQHYRKILTEIRKVQ
jgi:hypothetical protein